MLEITFKFRAQYPNHYLKVTCYHNRPLTYMASTKITDESRRKLSYFLNSRIPHAHPPGGPVIRRPLHCCSNAWSRKSSRTAAVITAAAASKILSANFCNKKKLGNDAGEDLLKVRDGTRALFRSL